MKSELQVWYPKAYLRILMVRQPLPPIWVFIQQARNSTPMWIYDAVRRLNAKEPKPIEATMISCDIPFPAWESYLRRTACALFKITEAELATYDRRSGITLLKPTTENGNQTFRAFIPYSDMLDDGEVMMPGALHYDYPLREYPPNDYLCGMDLGSPFGDHSVISIFGKDGYYNLPKISEESKDRFRKYWNEMMKKVDVNAFRIQYEQSPILHTRHIISARLMAESAHKAILQRCSLPVVVNDRWEELLDARLDSSRIARHKACKMVTRLKNIRQSVFKVLGKRLKAAFDSL